MATKEAKHFNYIVVGFFTLNVIFLFNFDPLASWFWFHCTFISVVTLQKIWYVLYFLTTAVKSQTKAQQMICFCNDPSCLCLSTCGWAITRVWGWRKPAYLISWASDGIVRSPRFWSSRRKLLLFPVLEFISCMGEVEKWQGKPLSFREDWKVALVLPGRPKVQEVNVKSHSK